MPLKTTVELDEENESILKNLPNHFSKRLSLTDTDEGTIDECNTSEHESDDTNQSENELALKQENLCIQLEKYSLKKTNSIDKDNEWKKLQLSNRSLHYGESSESNQSSRNDDWEKRLSNSSSINNTVSTQNRGKEIRINIDDEWEQHKDTQINVSPNYYELSELTQINRLDYFSVTDEEWKKLENKSINSTPNVTCLSQLIQSKRKENNTDSVGEEKLEEISNSTLNQSIDTSGKSHYTITNDDWKLLENKSLAQSWCDLKKEIDNFSPYDPATKPSILTKEQSSLAFKKNLIHQSLRQSYRPYYFMGDGKFHFYFHNPLDLYRWKRTYLAMKPIKQLIKNLYPDIENDIDIHSVMEKFKIWKRVFVYPKF